MLQFSQNPEIAEKQMNAVIFYMVAFGYIDGEFDLSERNFVRQTIHQMVEDRASLVLKSDSPAREDIVNRFVKHFNEVFEETDRQVRNWFNEVVADGENPKDFVYAKLKLKSFELFKTFDEANQQKMLTIIDELIVADGNIHPAEKKFRDEIEALLDIEIDLDDLDLEHIQSQVSIDSPTSLSAADQDHPFFNDFEEHYSKDPAKIVEQSEADRKIIERTMSVLDASRQKHAGILEGKHSSVELDGHEAFLDGHVAWHPVEKDKQYDVTVLGDLHGCYSCLKAALSQSNFFAKLEAFKLDPQKNPDPKLVLLGDYIDRGRFSYNGVLRAVMQLYLSAPEHVYPLRGNHEYYIEYKGRVYGGVKPAEAINSLVGYMPDSMFTLYMKLFESLPCSLILGRHFFVHAGIPRDSLLKERWTDLSSLNDPEIRFQMLWSDPSMTDVVPDDLQAQNARFPFGRNQFERFMANIGCTTMVRGHEKLAEGFKTIYGGEGAKLLNVFSAGGKTNKDIPEDSSYRDVTPMAITMNISQDETKITPWAIDYPRFNDPARNRFFAKAPEIAHKTK